MDFDTRMDEASGRRRALVDRAEATDGDRAQAVAAATGFASDACSPKAI